MKGQTRSADFARKTVRHQVYVERYTVPVVRRMLALLERTDKEIADRIKALEPDKSAASRGQMEAAIAEIEVLNKRLTADLQQQIATGVTQLGSYEGAFTASLASATFDVQWNGPTVEQLRAAAMSRPFQGVHLQWANLDQHVDEFGRRRGALIRDTIRRGFLQGEGIDPIVRQIRGTRALQYKDGLMDASRRTVETIVRTAVNHTANAAREEVYKVNGHLIESVQWISVIDHRTSSICRTRNNEVYPVDKGPRPPAHPNCRSTTIPIFTGEKAVERIGYGEWLKQQDSATVEEILGKQKAALFTDGKLPIDRFVDNSGKEYTIDQLRQKEAKAFKLAGI